MITPLLIGLLLVFNAPNAAPAGRSVAVTFDDLPGPEGSVVSNDPAALRGMTARLLGHLREHQIQVTAFVNEGKLFRQGEGADAVAARTGLLELWLDAGQRLGNHTYSHHSLNRVPLEAFQADVVNGETVTRRLLEARGQTLRDFRHPYLQVGLELPKRRAFEQWVTARGYRIAPVTIDNDEWVYAAVYADALRRGDTALATKVRADYVRYMDEVFGFIEGVSRRLLGREPAQVLLVHANALNADALGDLAKAIIARGYRFVTLDEALRDEAYARRDDYVGVWGISWLHHWEVTEGRPRTPSPDPPAWLTAAYDAYEARRRR